MTTVGASPVNMRFERGGVGNPKMHNFGGGEVLPFFIILDACSYPSSII